jgi:prepilin-type N-terminal cleavage/methylation domain-containing protein
MMKKTKGFTLVEFLMVTVLIGILFSMGANILSEGFNSYQKSSSILSADAQGTLAMYRLVKELRTTAAISSATSTALTITDSSNTSITYQKSGSSLLRNSQILADNVNSLTFTYYDDNGAVTATTSSIRYIKITLNLINQGTNLTFLASVNLRNVP